jgi:hypothetical protein
MDTVDLNDAYTVRSLDDLAKIYAKPLPKIANKETVSTVRPRAMRRVSCSCSMIARC